MPLSTHVNADRALAGQGMLRAVFCDDGKGVRPKIVDGAGQHNRRASGPRCRDAVVEHRKHQRLPILVAGRVYRMRDDRCLLGGLHDVGGVHRVALDPFVVRPPCCASRHVAAEGADMPATGSKATCDGAADAARGTEDECDLSGVGFGCHGFISKG